MRSHQFQPALLVCAWLVLFGNLVQAEDFDWPQWRGPNRDDISTETGLLREWPEEGPKRLWLSREAGIGYSGPAIVNGRLFTMGAIEGVEFLIALDAQTGKKIWSAAVGPTLENGWGDGPRATPTVDGAFVYAMGGQGNLICARVANGKVRWRKSMTKDLGGRVPQWGYTESVLIDRGNVICTPGGKEGAMAALDKRRGRVVWRSKEFTDGAQYASIIAVDHAGVRQYVQLTQKHVVGIDAAKGRLVWSSDWAGKTAVIPTPIYHDGHVYVTSGYNVGCALLQLDRRNNVTEVYANRNMKNHHGGVVLVGDHLYGYSDGHGWICQDFKTGEIVWNEKKALGKGAIAYADGRLVCLSERDGTVVLIEASPEGWNERGRFVLDPQTELRKPRGKIWTHPVIAGGKLYLRDQDLIYCYDIRAGKD